MNQIDEDVLALFIPILAISGGFIIAFVAIVAGVVKSNVRTRQIEESRREIAAYVAEGSMTPEDAERLIRAGRSA